MLPHSSTNPTSTSRKGQLLSSNMNSIVNSLRHRETATILCQTNSCSWRWSRYSRRSTWCELSTNQEDLFTTGMRGLNWLYFARNLVSWFFEWAFLQLKVNRLAQRKVAKHCCNNGYGQTQTDKHVGARVDCGPEILDTPLSLKPRRTIRKFY